MDEYEYAIKVPKDRVAVIIGEKGEKKRELEEALGVDVQIDSEEGDVVLSGGDAIALFTAREVIKAIARGFNPDIAKQLLKTDYILEIVSLSDYSNGKNQMIRLKGRVIGEGGRSRNTIEELAEVNICVYGKTIGIIGLAENVTLAKRAVDALLSGAPHSTVYRMLERARRDMKRQSFAEMNAPRKE
jgi:ribosomal RNA assembly protein